MNAIGTLPALVQAFFMDRLMQQRQASPHTVASYRDTFRLLLQYAKQRLGKAPSDLTVPELDAPLLGAFLSHLERERKNSARSRNVRLAAIHSFFRPSKSTRCSLRLTSRPGQGAVIGLF
jgi:integrase/recombinase XerD